MKTIENRFIRALYFTAIILLLSGCNLTNPNSGMQTPQQLVAQKQTMIEQAIAQTGYTTPQDPNGSFTVELRNAYGARSRIRLPLQAGLCVQDALRLSKAIEQFDNMQVKLKRPTKDPRRFLPLDVQFDAEYRLVEPLNDYALHNGDYIVVTQSAGADIGELLEGASGPLF
ncbi:MAG: hypothetical protein CMJ76_15105 [Planctomycetaceae bacterium]|nr:hypothetical protein [Planctomycetaceae bacterium]|tara:strand:+ start:1355 stop:1867 length:513 start_codon:yes stop_codon:yes gene_type:complete